MKFTNKLSEIEEKELIENYLSGMTQKNYKLDLCKCKFIPRKKTRRVFKIGRII